MAARKKVLLKVIILGDSGYAHRWLIPLYDEMCARKNRIAATQNLFSDYSQTPAFALEA
jgi:hypothetical protein